MPSQKDPIPPFRSDSNALAAASNTLKEYRFTSLGIACRVADPLAAESRQELVEFIRRPGKTMILCDGGNKPAELKAVVGIAKPGDIVLAHDYASDREVFESEIRGKRWNWCEITDADLPSSGIRPIKSQMLRDAMWFCGKVQSISATHL